MNTLTKCTNMVTWIYRTQYNIKETSKPRECHVRISQNYTVYEEVFLSSTEIVFLTVLKIFYFQQFISLLYFLIIQLS